MRDPVDLLYGKNGLRIRVKDALQQYVEALCELTVSWDQLICVLVEISGEIEIEIIEFLLKAWLHWYLLITLLTVFYHLLEDGVDPSGFSLQ